MSLKYFLTIFMLIVSQPINATEVLTPINNLFDAMREHDGKKLLAQFSHNATLDRAMKNSTKTSDLKKFAQFVTKSSKHLDEKLLQTKLFRSGNLASVWTPFAFYLDGKLSHCGVNSFQLVKLNDEWKIHYLIDNSYKGDCTEFIKNIETSIDAT